MAGRVRASAVCVQAGRLLCVRLRDPTTRTARLFPPGGAIEAGETPARTAERETLEETGYEVRADPTRVVTASYPFEWDGRRYDVTTHFVWVDLCAPSAQPKAVHDADFHEGVVWISLAAVAHELAYEPAILAAVQALTRA